jgi:hypothetical protein
VSDERLQEAIQILRANKWRTTAENLDLGLLSPAEAADQVRTILSVMRTPNDGAEAKALEILDALAAEDT